MIRHILLFILAIIAVMHARGALAQPAASQTTQKNAAQSTTQQSALAIGLDASFNSNLKPANSDESDQSTALEIAPSLKLKNNLALSSSVIIRHALSGYNDTTVDNIPITLKKSIQIQPTLTTSLSLGGILPANEEAREDASLRGGAQIGADLNKQTSLNKKATRLSLLTSVLKNVHEFDRSNTGAANLSYRARIQGSAEIQISKKLSVSGLVRYDAGRTYTDALRTRFVIDETISLSLNESASIYVSHTNAGNALDASGTDSNVELFDKNSSTVAVGVSGRF